MGRYPQKSNSHGSLKDLQDAINKKKKYLDVEISKIIGKQMKIDWKSPLKADNYAKIIGTPVIQVFTFDIKLC